MFLLTIHQLVGYSKILAPTTWGYRMAYSEKGKENQPRKLSVSANDDSETSAKKREQDIALKEKISQHPRPV